MDTALAYEAAARVPFGEDGPPELPRSTFDEQAMAAIMRSYGSGRSEGLDPAR